MGLLGPVDAVAQREAGGAWVLRDLDTELAQAVGPGLREPIVDVAAGGGKPVLAVAAQVVAAVAAGDRAVADQRLHEFDAQLAGEVVIASARGAEGLGPRALPQ